MFRATSRQSGTFSGFGGLLAPGRWCAVGALSMAPINKPATTTLLALALLFSLLGADAGSRWRFAWRNPVVKGFLLWGTVLVVSGLRLPGLLISTGSFVLACTYPLILGSLLQEARWGRRALTGFAISAALVMLASYGMDAGLIPQHASVAAAPNMRNTVFKEYTQQGLSTLLLGCLAMAGAAVATSRLHRVLLSAVALASAANVALVLGSRTAHLALIPLVAFWAWRLSARHQVYVRSLLVLGALAAIGSVALLSPLMHERLVRSLPGEAVSYVEGHSPTATGIRMRLWRRSLDIIAEAPVFGHGLGQWRPLYAESMRVHGDGEPFRAGHPHQEVLLILAEQGILGLVIWLLLIVSLSRHIESLDPPWRDTYLCILAVYLIAGLANCLWADFTHRHVFVLLAACLPALMQKPSEGPSSR